MDFASLLVQLIIDTSASWVRMFIALGLSVIISIFVGVYAATYKVAERFLLPVLDILQTVPILAFFPFALYVFVVFLPGYIGINAAVIFLIVTSMVWNIIFGVYESIKTLPKEFMEISDLYNFSRVDRFRKIYMPAALPRIVEQSILSWSIGLFYLVTSEIFSVGVSQKQVTYGIGVAFATIATQGVAQYAMALAVFVCFVVATRFLFFMPIEKYATKYMKQNAKPALAGRYEKAMANWIARRTKKVPVIIKHNPIINGKRKPVNYNADVQEHSGGRRIYYIFGAAVAIMLVYIFLSNNLVLRYEMESLVALAFSFVRVWAAFIAILAVAIPVCVYLVFVSKISSKYLLLFQILASIPATVLLPAIAISIKNGDLVAFVVFFLSGIWYIIFSVMASTRTLPQTIFEVKRIFGVRGKSAWRNIYLKAIMPGLVTGALTGIAAEWNASIVAEYFTTTGVSGTNVISSVGIGLGKLLDLSISTPGGLLLMAIALLNLVAMIVLVNTFVWKRLYRQVSKVYGG